MPTETETTPPPAPPTTPPVTLPTPTVEVTPVVLPPPGPHDAVGLDIAADAAGEERTESKDIPDPPGTDGQPFMRRSAVIAAAVSMVLNLFPMLRLIRAGSVPWPDALIDFAEMTAQDFAAAFLGVVAAGRALVAK